MKAGKILIAAIVISIVSAVYGGLTCGWLFRGSYNLEPTNIWRPMEGPPGGLFYIGMFLLNLILAGVYSLLSGALPGKAAVTKGIVFGFIVWLVGILPGMFFTSLFMTIANEVVLYWTISDLVLLLLKGMIIAPICK